LWSDAAEAQELGEGIFHGACRRRQENVWLHNLRHLIKGMRWCDCDFMAGCRDGKSVILDMLGVASWRPHVNSGGHQLQIVIYHKFWVLEHDWWCWKPCFLIGTLGADRSPLRKSEHTTLHPPIMRPRCSLSMSAAFWCTCARAENRSRARTGSVLLLVEFRLPISGTLMDNNYTSVTHIIPLSYRFTHKQLLPPLELSRVLKPTAFFQVCT